MEFSNEKCKAVNDGPYDLLTEDINASFFENRSFRM